MAIKIDNSLTPRKLVPKITRLFELSAGKILSMERTWVPARGAPVFTVKGVYTSRGWTEWTQGFEFGSALLQYDATGEKVFLQIGRSRTVERMARHVSHVGVHDHGFNIISTYGNLWRLMREGKIPHQGSEKEFYELALKVSGAVQAARWTPIAIGQGFIYSFNGPHSLFIDTMRSLRSLAVAHQLGHILMGEQDAQISLLQRLLEHAAATARYNLYYGEGRDIYDERGRTAQEIIFNLNDGQYRCPSSQQGYSPFTTWMRGLSWGLLGFAEQLEFIETAVGDRELERWKAPGKKPRGSKGLASSYNGGRLAVTDFLRKAAESAADFFIEKSCADGVPMWDSHAPNLHRLGDYQGRPADPFNPWEPVDSSAAAIAAQGLVRLGNYLLGRGERKSGTRYRQAGLTVANTLFDEPYLSDSKKHQGLILHSVYHRPNGWDYVAPGQKVPNGESSIWGDYHARELALLLWREAQAEKYLTFFK